MNALQMEEMYEAIDKVISEKAGCKPDGRGSGKTPFIVFFGANKASEIGIKYLQEKGIAVSAIIDNSAGKEGTVRCGITVFTPEKLLSAYRENAVIFIASRYVRPMTAQLENMGYRRAEHIFETIYHIPTLKEEEFDRVAEKVEEGEKLYRTLGQKEDETLILCPYKGIGDIYFIGAYFKEYCRKENICKYRFVVVGGACKRVAAMFGIEPVAAISQREADRIIRYISFVGNKKLNVRILNHNYMHYDILTPFEVHGRVSWGTMFLHGILEFACVASIRASKPERKKADISRYRGMKKGKTVILAPYANTVSNADVRMWERLAEKYGKSGYAVFTNSIGEKEPVIKGTMPLAAPLEEMPDLVEYAGTFIGIRSGICDLVASAKAEKIVLYPDKSSLFFKMEDMGIAQDVTEICI